MYALIINNEVFIFDISNYYGLYLLDDVNLDGYLKILDFKEVLFYYENNYQTDLDKLEQYLEFLHSICLKFLKDLLYV